MVLWYLINTIEIIFGIFFLMAAIKFFFKKEQIRNFKYIGLAFLCISILSFTALAICVRVSGITV
ncbi:hypothetical protein [Viridibacillus arvi]|uniref:hypothetical protein n=1 Tax=Viridibacillus arvi TaxID=263475 RepID=UPI0034CFB76A